MKKISDFPEGRTHNTKPKSNPQVKATDYNYRTWRDLPQALQLYEERYPSFHTHKQCTPTHANLKAL
jgi:hypothetical protein